jgi:D-sedoheptulose 7-phosphate isomerase
MPNLHILDNNISQLNQALNYLKRDNKKIIKIIKKVKQAIKKKRKLFICGNGGSYADAEHIATEFVVRFQKKINRKSIPMINLGLNGTNITACSNDYNFKYAFSRPLEGLGTNGDILFILSTSGNSQNIIEVLKLAKKMKIYTIGFLGLKGGLAKNFCNLKILVKSNNVARIQECHKFLGHTIIEYIEKQIF